MAFIKISSINYGISIIMHAMPRVLGDWWDWEGSAERDNYIWVMIWVV